MNKVTSFLRRIFARLALCGVGILFAADDAGELAKLQNIPDSFGRNAAVRALLKDADAPDLRGYFESARRLPYPARKETVSQILRHWAAKNPPDALAACLSMEPPMDRGPCAQAIFEAWGQASPDLAFKALLKYENTPQSRMMAIGFIEGYARANPGDAFRFFMEKRAEHPNLFSDYRALPAIFQRWGAQAPETALRALIGLRQDEGNYFSASAVMSDWFARDPKACLRAIARTQPEFQSDLIYASVYGNISFERAGGILDRIRANFMEMTPYVAGYIFEYLAKEDLARALAMARNIKDPEESQEALESVLEAWSNADFAGAVAAAQQIEDPSVKNKFLYTLWVKHVDVKKLPETMPAVMAIGDPALRNNLIHRFCGEYLQKGGDIGVIMQDLTGVDQQRDLLLALARAPNGSSYWIYLDNIKSARKLREWAVALLPSSELRARLLSATLRPRAIEIGDLCWMNEKLPPGEARRVLSEVIYSDRADKLLTVQNYNSLPEGAMKDMFAASMLREMSKKSPEEAREWITAMPAGSLRDEAYRNLIEAFLEKGELEKALSAINAPPTGIKTENYFYARVAEKIAKKNPDEAIAWALSLTDKEAREMAVARAAENWSPQDAMGFFERIRTIPEGAEKNSALSAFVEAWGMASPKEAAAWIKANAQINAEVAKGATGSVWGRWLKNDPMAATQWLGTLPPGDVRNQAIVALSNSEEAQKSPDAVLEWVISMTPKGDDRYMREGTIACLVWRVAQKDVNAARALLENPGLSDADRLAAKNALEAYDRRR